jgi:hypothetical protein
LSTENDDPIFELFKAEMMDKTMNALRLHGALAQAYLERTGLELERESPFTVDDVKRAGRILRSEGTEKGSVGSRKHVAEILQLRKPKEGA